MAEFPLWADMLYNTPIALDRFKNDVFCQIAEARILGEKPAKIDVAALHEVQARSDEATYYSDTGRKPFLHRGHIAVIPVRGTLVHRGSYMAAESGLLGYNRILEQRRAAQRAPDIKGVFMPFDSGGGSCAGMLAAAEEMATMTAAEGGKPTYAYLDDKAASAAYVLASTCDKIIGRRETMAGSLAAIMNMVDKSKAYEKIGLRPVVVRASWADLKARGQDGEEIDADLVAKMREMVDDMSNMIAEFVAAMRGITEKSIRDMRGEVFLAGEALRRGLVDEIASEQEAWDMLEAELIAA